MTAPGGRWLVVAWLAVAIGAAFASGAAAQLRVDITRGTVEPLAIAIPDLYGEKPEEADYGKRIAGVIAVLLTTGGQGLKGLAGGSPEGVAAWIAGGCFVSALALASGIWTGNRRLFEALYLTLWYIGPMQKVTALDYAGLSAAAVDAGLWRVYGLTAFLLLVAAAAGFGRSSQNRA